MGELPNERPKQLTPSSFGRDAKLGVPYLDSAGNDTGRPNLTEKARYNSLLKIE